MRAVRLCRENGIKVGLRFTLTQDNAEELPELLKIVDDEDIDKFYLSHLNYAGRGNRNRKDDVVHQLTRWAMDLLFERCWNELQQGKIREYVTGNNDADGVYLLYWVRKNHPELENFVRERLEAGAAMHRVCMWLISIIWVMCTLIPSGGITTWATSKNAHSRKFGKIVPTH